MENSNVGQSHINQFNVIFERGIISNVVSKTLPLELKGMKLIFENIEIRKPYILDTDRRFRNSEACDFRLLPNECREQSKTYGGQIFLKMKLMYKDRILFDDYKPAGIFPCYGQIKLMPCLGNR